MIASISWLRSALNFTPLHYKVYFNYSPYSPFWLSTLSDVELLKWKALRILRSADREKQDALHLNFWHFFFWLHIGFQRRRLKWRCIFYLWNIWHLRFSFLWIRNRHLVSSAEMVQQFLRNHIAIERILQVFLRPSVWFWYYKFVRSLDLMWLNFVFFFSTIALCGPGSSVGIASDYGLDSPGIECRCGRFSAPVRNAPGVHPASCTIGTGSFPGVKSDWGVTLTPHPF